jgi:hypothetical protein
MRLKIVVMLLQCLFFGYLHDKIEAAALKSDEGRQKAKITLANDLCVQLQDLWFKILKSISLNLSKNYPF